MKIATCHPERPICAKGLCSPCYNREKRRLKPVKYNGYSKSYRLRHPERAKLMQRRYIKNNPEKRKATVENWLNKNGNRERRKQYNQRWMRETFNRRMARRYGVSEEIIAKARTSPCEICGGDKRIVLDHDSATVKFRGGLCNVCNTSLGKMGDNSAGVRRALDYLIRKEKQAVDTNVQYGI